MEFGRYLAAEWRPALGCTEPAAVAYATALAAAQGAGPVRSAHLVCDARMYKNCYAVGIPHSGGRTGIRWTLALGALLPDPSARLECFRQVDAQVLANAARLVEADALTVDVDAARTGLFVDCRVVRAGGVGRAVLEEQHTRLVRLERDGRPQPLPEKGPEEADALAPELERELAGLDFEAAIDLARSLGDEDRARLRRGCERNLAIARHGLGLFPPGFGDVDALDRLTRISRLVCAGVHARMSGADFTVMTLAGSGNKGITVSVPLTLWGRETGAAPERVDEALALACLVASQTTRRLGTLSAACGCASAAGIGLAAGLVLLQDGDAQAISRAVNNMVGNVTGMICDGAKMGCGLKTMTSVDAAFRAACLACSGFGIPATDGIVSDRAASSLANLERITRRGMAAMDAEILEIMQEKLRGGGPPDAALR